MNNRIGTKRLLIRNGILYVEEPEPPINIEQNTKGPEIEYNSPIAALRYHNILNIYRNVILNIYRNVAPVAELRKLISSKYTQYKELVAKYNKVIEDEGRVFLHYDINKEPLKELL